MQPAQCHTIPELWANDPYLSSKVTVAERDNKRRGERVLIKVGKMEFPSTLPYYEEVLLREAAMAFSNSVTSERTRQLVNRAIEEQGHIDKRTIVCLEQTARFRARPPQVLETKMTVYDVP